MRPLGYPGMPQWAPQRGNWFFPVVSVSLLVFRCIKICWLFGLKLWVLLPFQIASGMVVFPWLMGKWESPMLPTIAKHARGGPCMFPASTPLRKQLFEVRLHLLHTDVLRLDLQAREVSRFLVYDSAQNSYLFAFFFFGKDG